MSEEATTEFEDVRVIRESPKALLVRSDSIGPVWVPKSVIHDNSEVYGPGHVGKLVLLEWWAEREGLEP